MEKLTHIAKMVNGTLINSSKDVFIKGISHDSRDVGQGYIYAVIKGASVDGSSFIDSAQDNGAVALLSDKPEDTELPVIIVKDVRAALGYVSAISFGQPSKSLKVAGITGTNGKTTITYLVEAILNAQNINTGVMGTIEYRLKDKKWEANHTTPEAAVVQKILKKMLDGGANAVVMEASSHGLVQGRLNGVDFDVVAFTNLTQDHLDYHKTMESYGDAKMLLFTEAIAKNKEAVAVVNIDDPFGQKIIENTEAKVITVSTDYKSSALLKPVEEPVFTIDGTDVRVNTSQGEFDIDFSLSGKYNLNNMLMALGIGIAMGVGAEACCLALSEFKNVPGRLERVETHKGFSVFVDYAHTPDALQKVLTSLYPLTKGRVITVFGCGGDRDKEKRPLMGKAVAQNSDISIITSDNPRTEDPCDIIAMIEDAVIKEGMKLFDFEKNPNVEKGYLNITDRRDAINAAVKIARPDDTILIAGKGHEDYVIIGTAKTHFDDREEAKKALQKI